MWSDTPESIIQGWLDYEKLEKFAEAIHDLANEEEA